MTSGDTLLIFTPLHNEPAASNYATLVRGTTIRCWISTTRPTKTRSSRA